MSSSSDRRDPLDPPPSDRRRPRRVGLFGGSFDPVHRGHLHAARSAARAFDLDRVVFVPAARSPYKAARELAPGPDRVAMLERAIRGEPRFGVSTLELDRGGTSYTIDTVRALRAAIGESPDTVIYLILGSDNLVGLSGWKDARALFESVELVIVHRADDARSSLDIDAAVAEARARLGPEITEKLRAGYLSLPPVRVSSTRLRSELPGLAAETEDLDPDVLEYIRAHALYGSGERG